MYNFYVYLFLIMITESYKFRLKQLAGIISEGKHNNEYGALMFMIDPNNWDEVLKMIDKEDIYDEPGYGLEKEPHCTVLFGFHKDADVDKMIELIKDNVDDSIELTLEKTSHFKPKDNDYDVVKFDVESEELKKLNSIMRKNFKYTNDHPVYKAHVTVSYVKKGKGKKYDGNHKPIKIKSKEFTYSPPSGKKRNFTI